MIEQINLVSTIVMAIATVVLAGATIYYAITNRRLWLNMEKQVRKPHREEEIRAIIRPLLKQCEVEIAHLNEKRYRWYSKGIKLVDGFYKDSSLKIVFNAFLRERPPLKEGIEAHDKLVINLKKKFDDFEKFVDTSTFRSRIEKMIIELDKKNGKNTKKVDVGNVNYYVSMIIDCIIKNTDVDNNNLTGEFASFWKLYGNEFLDMKKQKEIKFYLDEIEKLSNHLKETINLIVKDL